MLRQLILSSLVLMLISCTSTQWVKPGATQEELEADTVTCNNQIITSGVGARGMMGMGASATRGRAAATAGAALLCLKFNFGLHIEIVRIRG